MQKQLLAMPRSPKTASMSGNLSGVSSRLVIGPSSVSLECDQVVLGTQRLLRLALSAEDEFDHVRLRDGLDRHRFGIGGDVLPPESAHPHLTQLLVEMPNHLKT